MASGYDKEHLLGQGAAGAVYRARCRRTGRAVALKVLLEPADEDGLRRFGRERRAHAEATPASDVYMVGLLVYEMVSGRRASEDLPAFLTALHEGRRGFPPASAANPALGPEVDRVLRHATEAQPGDRYARAGDLAGALEA